MIVKLMILALIAAFAGLFFIKGPSGEPILKLDDLKPDRPELSMTPSKPTKVYKWQDENGIWQFSNQPVEGENVEVMELDGKINTIPAVPIITQNPGCGAKQPATSSKPAIATIPSGLTSVSVEKIAEMMDAVNNLQETVDERKARMDKIVIGKN